jgi:hypothetical protein
MESMTAEVIIGNGVQTDGFAIVEGVISRATVDNLLIALERIGDTGSVRKRGGIFAVRNLLDASPEVRELANSDAVRELVEPVLGAHFFPVRGILFDKIPDANWKVPWHQDVTIAVQERVDADGFGPWSVKADVLHSSRRHRSWRTCSPCVSTSTTAARRMEPYVSSLDLTLSARFPRRRSLHGGRARPSRSALSVSEEPC